MGKIPVFLLSETSYAKNVSVMSSGAHGASCPTFLQGIAGSGRTAAIAASCRVFSGSSFLNEGVQREKGGGHQNFGILSGRAAGRYAPERFMRPAALDSPVYCHCAGPGLKSGRRMVQNAFLSFGFGAIRGIPETDGYCRDGQQRNAGSASPADQGSGK